MGSCIKSKEENNENNQIRLLVPFFLKVIFLAEFLLTRNFVLRVEEDSELLLEFTNTKLTREHVYFIHFRDGFIGTSFASFIFFLPSSLKFEWADFPLLSL